MGKCIELLRQTPNQFQPTSEGAKKGMLSTILS